MYKREEAKALKQNFWIKFGQYMSPIPSASGEKVNWVNYKTGVKPIQLKMDATQQNVEIGFWVLGNDEVRKKMMLLFEALKDELPKGFVFEKDVEDVFGKKISWIKNTLTGVNIFDQESWPKIIGFLKENMLALDTFWANNKDSFEMLNQ